MNSLSSRPRSPTKQITTQSASIFLASFANNEVLPTPLPAKTPSRCPLAIGKRVSSTACFVLSRYSSFLRSLAAGGSLRNETGVRPCNRIRPSSGSPNAFTTRPIQSRLGRKSNSGTNFATAPIAGDVRWSKGERTARSEEIATTSAKPSSPTDCSICTRSPVINFSQVLRFVVTNYQP